MKIKREKIKNNYSKRNLYTRKKNPKRPIVRTNPLRIDPNRCRLYPTAQIPQLLVLIIPPTPLHCTVSLFSLFLSLSLKMAQLIVDHARYILSLRSLSLWLNSNPRVKKIHTFKTNPFYFFSLFVAYAKILRHGFVILSTKNEPFEALATNPFDF